MNLSRCLKRLVAVDSAMGGGAASLRNVIVWVFIALVALFLTHPGAISPAAPPPHSCESSPASPPA